LRVANPFASSLEEVSTVTYPYSSVLALVSFSSIKHKNTMQPCKRSWLSGHLLKTYMHVGIPMGMGI
jgi:hypothetical protein